METISELIKKRALRFVKSQFLGLQDDEKPLVKIYKMCELNQTKGYRYIKGLLTGVNDDGRNLSVKEKFANEMGTKAITYRILNPQLKVHNVYKSDEYINERERIIFTRFRLSSHNLNIEKGRWSRID